MLRQSQWTRGLEWLPWWQNEWDLELELREDRLLTLERVISQIIVRKWSIILTLQILFFLWDEE